MQDALIKKDDERKLHAADCRVPLFVVGALDLVVAKEFPEE